MQHLTGAHNEIPVLETERLRLRGHRLEDFKECLALWGDPQVTRYIGGKPLTGEEVWARLLRYAGHWAMLGYGYWLIEDKASGRFIGEMGFADFKRDISPSFAGIPEIGWVLAPAAQGRGLATEALHAAVTWGDQTFGGKTTGCLINPDNVASIRVAEKGGYKFFCRTFYKEHPAIVFKRQGKGSEAK